MSTHYSQSDHQQWTEAGLKDFADCLTYCDQDEYGDGQLEGSWYYCDDETLTIYFGSFGNYNSAGASHHTYAEVYEDRQQYDVAVKGWEAKPEYTEEQEDRWAEEDAEDEEAEDEE